MQLTDILYNFKISADAKKSLLLPTFTQEFNPIHKFYLNIACQLIIPYQHLMQPWAGLILYPLCTFPSHCMLKDVCPLVIQLNHNKNHVKKFTLPLK